MLSRDAFAWFKRTFRAEIDTAIEGTPFTLDLLAGDDGGTLGGAWAAPSPDRLRIPV